jgi:hypothetical protein
MVKSMKNGNSKSKKYNKPKLKVYGDIKKHTAAVSGPGRRDAIYSAVPH